MKLFSRSSQYAMLALMQAVKSGLPVTFSAAEICESAGIPEPMGRKAVAALVKAHILRSTPGPGGGYALNRPLADVSLYDVVVAVEGDRAFLECPLGSACGRSASSGGPSPCASCRLTTPDCGLGHMCPLHHLWKETNEVVRRHLCSATLQQIADKLSESCVAT